MLALHDAVLATRPAVCSERATLVTRYHRRRAHRRLPTARRQAGALAHVLRHKQARIFPGELLVGGFTAHRVGGGLFPELHGLAMLEDLFRFERRTTNPMTLAPEDRRRLLAEVIPFWLPRFIGLRLRPLSAGLRLMAEQLRPSSYLLNELGGISHFVPDYRRLLESGTDGLRAEARRRAGGLGEAVCEVCDGLDAFAGSYRAEAERLAAKEPDPRRRQELEAIAARCARVPRRPAETLAEGLQSILFAQIALNLESLDNSVSPGRLDQLLYPLYRADVEAGRLDRAGALELLGCFAVKLCEIVPVFSERLTRFHGGLFNGQVVVVGGTDEEGNDATNELSLLFLELMDGLRTRQPNYHARIHRGSPPEYRARIATALASGAASPALYNDEVIVPVLQDRGMTLAHARDYATVGCVEPVSAGRSFLSTDAALFNLPLCLELALNQGRRFGQRRRVGAATRPVAGCESLGELVALLDEQVEHLVGRLVRDLRRVEEVNSRCHPTPLTSALVDGCLASGEDATRGGARYNGSGVQGVGVIDVGDALAAIDAVVFRDRRASLAEVVEACRADFVGHEGLRARLCSAPRFGNDQEEADALVARVMELFARALARHENTRGGRYAAGWYSVTAHIAFGEVVGALPSGRRAGAPFSSGISPASGSSRGGPTAALSSAASLPARHAPNGVNFNLELAPWTVAGDAGARTLQALIDGGFGAGCMQLQVNVFDPRQLVEARDHPGRYPGLLVRVSGYSAYFDDLADDVKQEIIDRTLHGVGDSRAPVG